METFRQSVSSILETHGVVDGSRRLVRGAVRRGKRNLLQFPVIHSASLKTSLDRLTTAKTGEETASDAFETPYRYDGAGLYSRLAPMQTRSEWAQLFEFVRDEQPRTVVEIGTAYGGTIYPWSRPSTSPETVVSVDMGYLGRDTRFYEAFAADSPTDATFFDRNSQSEATRDAVVDELDGDAVEFLFVDGDHSYDGVRRDWELYSELVAPGGLVAFHDISESNPMCGVGDLWADLKEQFETWEFVDDADSMWNGIGVLRME